AYVAGLARTYQFPLVDSLMPQKQDDYATSAFVAKVGRAGGLLYSKFIRTGQPSTGGSLRNDVPFGAAAAVAVGSVGAGYVTGDVDTYSNFQPTASAFQKSFGGWEDAMIVKLSGSTATLAITSSANPVDARTPFTVTATVSGGLSGLVEFRDGPFSVGSAF